MQEVYLLWYCTDMLMGVFSSTKRAEEARNEDGWKLYHIQEVEIDAADGCIH